MKLNGQNLQNEEKQLESNFKVKRVFPVDTINVLQVFPEKNEALSSWLFRQAKVHYCKSYKDLFLFKLESFQNDIDCLLDIKKIVLPGFLVKEEDLIDMTVFGFKNQVFKNFKTSKFIPWLLPFSSKSGQQFCPKCFKENRIPYLKLSWRFSLFFFCEICFTYLQDNCSNCGHKFNFNRFEDSDLDIEIHLKYCSKCKYDLSNNKVEKLSKQDLILANRIIRILEKKQEIPCSITDYLTISNYFTYRFYCDHLRSVDFSFINQKKDRAKYLETESKLRAELIRKAFDFFDEFPSILNNKPVSHLKSSAFWSRGLQIQVEWYLKMLK